MESRKLVLMLNYAPSVNHYWLANGSRRYISPKGRAFRQHVIDSCPANHEAFQERLFVTVNVYPPDRRRRDIDNICKGVLDSLEHAGVYVNDSQIDKLLVVRKDIVPYGQIEVTIEPLF